MVKSFFITIVALLFSTCLFGQEKTPKDLVKSVYPRLYTKYTEKLDSLPSCHYFLIDASTSIRAAHLDGPIINALTAYLNGLPDNDFITIIIFGETQKTKSIGIPNSIINDKTRSTILEAIRSIQFDQNESDTYAGMDKLIKSMEQAGHELDQKNVFILTDFLFYTSGGQMNNKNWAELQNKISNLKETSSINAEAIQLLQADVQSRPDFVKPKLDMVFDTILPYESCTNSYLLNLKFKNMTTNNLKKKLEAIVIQDAKYEKNHFSIEMKNGEIKLLQCNLYSKIELSEKSQQLLKKKMEIPLFSFFPPSKDSISIDGLMIAENYKYFEGTKERHEMEDILQDYSFQDRRIEIQLKDSLIPWWLTDIITIFLIITLYQIFSTLKKRKFIGDIYFYPPRGFQGSFKNIDANLNGISSAIVGENIAVSSYGKAIDVKNNLGSNKQFTLKAKKKFFGPKVIEIKSLSGFPLDVISVEKKIRIISPETKPKSIKPGSVWRINNVEITLPRVK